MEDVNEHEGGYNGGYHRRAETVQKAISNYRAQENILLANIKIITGFGPAICIAHTTLIVKKNTNLHILISQKNFYLC